MHAFRVLALRSVVDEYLHSERTADRDRLSTDVSGAHHSKRLSVQLHMGDGKALVKIRVIPLREHTDLLLHCGSQHQHQHYCRVGDSLRAVSRDIADANATRMTGLHVNIVVARSRFADELYRVRKPHDIVSVNRKFFADNDFRSF